MNEQEKANLLDVLLTSGEFTVDEEKMTTEQLLELRKLKDKLDEFTKFLDEK